MQLPRYHRLRSAYYQLEGRVCVDCGAVHFPIPPSCSDCGSRGLEAHSLSGRGSVYSYSEAVQAPEGFAPPHLMALIELEEGPVVAAQLADVEPEEVEIGMEVEMVTRRIRELAPQGYLVYGYKFRPRLAAEAGS